MTLRVLKHELRTPINHIIGYSEMLMEDLTQPADLIEKNSLLAIHAMGKELVTLINLQLGSSIDPDVVASPELLVALRDGARRILDRILAQNLAESTLASSKPHLGDVRKILEAVARLAEFIHTGHPQQRMNPRTR